MSLTCAPPLLACLCVLQKYHGDQKTRVLVFALYKKEAARLEQSLQRQGWNCVAIHGDKAQGDRYTTHRPLRR